MATPKSSPLPACVALFLLLALPALGGINRWTIAGPESAGVARQIVFDPGDSSIVYCATLNGLFRSTDHGVRWSAVAQLFTRQVFDVAVVRSDPRQVYAAAGGEIFKSDDRGVTWRVVNTASSFFVAVSPQNANIVYSVSLSGPVRSDDGGVTFAPAGSGAPNTANVLVVDPQSPDTVYAGSQALGGIYKTTDGGAHWTRAVNTGISFLQPYWLAVDPSNGSTLYAGAQQSGVYKTTNGFTTWTALPTGFPNASCFSLAVDPHSTGTLLAATNFGALKSTDAGATWTRLQLPVGAEATVDAVAIDPVNGANMLVNTRGKVLRSTDGGATFADATSGLLSFSAEVLAVDRHDDAIVYTGGFSGFAKSTDHGESWSVSDSIRPVALAVDAGSSVLYAIAAGVVRRSTDGGTTWPVFNAGLPPLLLPPAPSAAATFLAADPQLPGTLYTIAGGTLYKKSGDDPWSARGAGLSGTPSFITVDPHSSSTLYAGGTAGLFKSTDGADSWSLIMASPGGSLAPRGLAVDPFDSRHLFTWTTVADYQSTDGGITWSPFTPPVINAAIVFDGAHAGVLYASTGGSLQRSTDGGKTWISLQSGLNFHSLLVVGPRGTTLYVGGGPGVFVFEAGRSHAASH